LGHTSVIAAKGMADREMEIRSYVRRWAIRAKDKFPAEDPLTLSRADVTMNVFTLKLNTSR
jgi:hypothetical protein